MGTDVAMQNQFLSLTHKYRGMGLWIRVKLQCFNLKINTGEEVGLVGILQRL